MSFQEEGEEEEWEEEEAETCVDAERDGCKYTSGKPFVDRLINTEASAKKDRNQYVLRAKKSYRDLFNEIDFRGEVAYRNIFSLLWSSTLPCFALDGPDDTAMIKRCEWKGVKVPCARIFTMFPTDRGMCCTFNLDAADKMFKASSYQVWQLDRISRR